MSGTRMMRVLVTVRPAHPGAQAVPMGPAEAAEVLAEHSHELRSMRVYPHIGQPADIDPETVFGIAGLAGWLAWADHPAPGDKVVLPTVDGGVFEAEVVDIGDVDVSVQLT